MNMNICHCLFFYKNDKIVSILQKNIGMEIIKFSGNDYIEYSQDFWENWIDYAGCTSNTMLDFCIVYDKELYIPKQLEERYCDRTDSIWSKNNVKNTIEKFINITNPIEIYEKNGSLFFKMGSFLNIGKKDILTINIKDINVDDNSHKSKINKEVLMTPFIESMVEIIREPIMTIPKQINKVEILKQINKVEITKKINKVEIPKKINKVEIPKKINKVEIPKKINKVEITKQVNNIVLSEEILQKIVDLETIKELRKLLQKTYYEHEKKLFRNKWISFSMNEQEGYYCTQCECAIPIQNNYDAEYNSYFDKGNYLASEKEIKNLLYSDCPQRIVDGIEKSITYSSVHYVGYNKGSIGFETKKLVDWNNEDSVKLGMVKISQNDFLNFILCEKYIILSDDVFRNAVVVLKNRKINDISMNEVLELAKIFQINVEEIRNKLYNHIKNHKYIMSDDDLNLYIEQLLNCDKIRVDLEKYTKKRIEDVNSGHWDLWLDNNSIIKNGTIWASLKEPLIARNSIADIHSDGLIGIDFGTKSTIVSKRDGKEKITLMRVGIGQLTKEAEAYHYENPTIMEFRDLNKFIENYNAKIGRPETSIDDLRVSHTANNDLKSCSISDEFYSYFYDIKQWCSDTERNVKIIDQRGIERVLPAFVALEEDTFNPLEVYAYYLGMCINNMRNGIYLDYVLSFPVTYEKAVKEKILDSFTKGLKKSLPEAVLNDANSMKKFRVQQGVSEPVAYAITALQGYGFEPKEDEKILYSIFDFGGGTTDIDFGLWRLSNESKREEKAYDYVIEHFCSEGDKYLGGENLLELMAFEIFKANVKFLGKTKDYKDNNMSAGFSFTKPKECDEFVGSEMFISSSQEARRNTKQLMEVLRPFWEGIIGIAKENTNKVVENKEDNTISYKGYIFKNTEDFHFPIKDGVIEVDLFDKDGNRKQKQKLYIEKADANINVDLIKILEKRIERGIQLFFNAIIQVFKSKSVVVSGVNDMQIFLAGNSSKSPILRKIFDNYISGMSCSLKQEDGMVEYFHLFPPLATKEAFDIQTKRGINVDTGDINSPTGKTGVAYGLIAGRKGGKIKVISEVEANVQTKFRYNIGIAKRGKFIIKLDRNKIPYGQWVRLINAREEDFEIYYTSAPIPQGAVPINSTGIYNKRCRIDEVDEDADIYIRCVEDAPEELEYCVSIGEPNDDVEVTRIRLVE